MAAQSEQDQNDRRALPKRQPAGTGRRSPGACGLIPGKLALHSTAAQGTVVQVFWPALADRLTGNGPDAVEIMIAPEPRAPCLSQQSQQLPGLHLDRILMFQNAQPVARIELQKGGKVRHQSVGFRSGGGTCFSAHSRPARPVQA